MNIEGLRKRLLAAAQTQAPSDQAPYAFEKRVMARLATAPIADIWTVWNRILWRAAAPCVALTLVISTCSYLSPGNGTSAYTLADDLETTVYAPLESMEDMW
jgi:hypothetical protein